MGTKISELSAAGALAGTESVPVVQSGSTKKTTAQAIANLAPSGSDVWADYTPSFTNLTVGNGTLVGRYSQSGKTVKFKVSLVFGSTTSITASSAVRVSVPVTAASGRHVVAAYYLDSGARHWCAVGVIGDVSSTDVNLKSPDSVASGDVAQTAPFTWTTNDVMVVGGTYEAA